MRPARPAQQRRRSYKLHIGGIGGGPGAGGVTGYTVAALVEDWRRRAAAPVEEREPADIEGARSRRHGPAARTRRAGVYAPLDWDNLPGRATRLLRLE